MSSRKLLKVLCLHGYRQNGQTFKEKTGSLRKVLKKHCQLVYITAPNLLPAIEGDNSEQNAFGWWFSKGNKTYVAQEVTSCCDGFEKSLEVVAKTLKEDGPFDGIIGFSQGASLLTVICSLKESGDDRFQNFKFAVFFAGFKSRQAQHQVFYEKPITISSLHVIGETDQVIEKEMSNELLKVFSNKIVVRHPGGHFIPTTSEQKKCYIEFFNSFLEVI